MKNLLSVIMVGLIVALAGCATLTPEQKLENAKTAFRSKVSAPINRCMLHTPEVKKTIAKREIASGPELDYSKCIGGMDFLKPIQKISKTEMLAGGCGPFGCDVSDPGYFKLPSTINIEANITEDGYFKLPKKYCFTRKSIKEVYTYTTITGFTNSVAAFSTIVVPTISKEKLQAKYDEDKKILQAMYDESYEKDFVKAKESAKRQFEACNVRYQQELNIWENATDVRGYCLALGYSKGYNCTSNIKF